MSDKRDEHKIEGLQQELYEHDFKSELPPTRPNLTSHEVDVEKAWKHEPIRADDGTPKPTRIVAGSFFKKVLTISLIFFIISAGLLVYMFLGGWNIISANNVDISFLGPVTIAAGDELNFDIVIDNQNRSAIENAVLHINYPDGTKEVEDITKDLTYNKFDVGEVLSKNTARRTSRSIHFGELNTDQKIKVALEYGLKNSNATFRKEKDYDVRISSTPLTLSVVHPEKVISNDSVEFKVAVVSNSSVPLTNLLLKAEYPFGFTFSGAVPQPNFDSEYWVIPNLNPGEKVEFVITGQQTGEENDERVFRFSVGSQDPANEKNMATRYLAQQESLFVQRPPIALTFELGRSTAPTYITQQGENIQADIRIKNNLPVQIVDARVELVFSGPLFDPNRVQSGSGFFQSMNNMIVWDKNTFDRLAAIDPGKDVNLSFSFATKSVVAEAIKNGTMTLKANVVARRVSETDMTNTVSSSVSRMVRTQTSIGLLSQITYSTGPFRNRGPIPPKLDNKTTYTVTWSATNSSNDARGAEVRAILPPSVRWLGVSDPLSETITWNSDKNEVIWRVGDLVAGTGLTRKSREVSFQIELLPTLSQVGTSPTLVDQIKMTAVDSFTNATLNAENRDMTTRLTNDPKYNGEEERVTQ